eukprot:s6280_g6.t2
MFMTLSLSSCRKPAECIANADVNALRSGRLVDLSFMKPLLQREGVVSHNCHVREGEEVVGPQDGLPTWLVEVVVSRPTPREALDFLMKLEAEIQALVKWGQCVALQSLQSDLARTYRDLQSGRVATADNTAGLHNGSTNSKWASMHGDVSATSALHVEAAQLPKQYPLQLGLAYLLLVGYLVRTLFVSLCLPASVGVILTGWSFSYFIQEDIFVGRDMLQELAFFLVLLTAGLEISILHLKPYFFVLALVPCTAELLAIAAYSVCNLGFTWAEGLNLGTVLVAVGDGLVIPKMKEFSVLHKQHPMPYLMLCWAPVEASYALTLFGVFTAVSAPATMPSLNIVLLLASTVIRIAATVVVGAALGYAAWFLIDKRREATLFGHQVFTNQPVEAFLMLLAVALCAYGLGSNTKGRPTLPLFLGCGSLFQPELMVIVVDLGS